MHAGKRAGMTDPRVLPLEGIHNFRDYGGYRADGGTVEVDGRITDIRSPHDAIAAGIGMVHQHFMLVDTLTALENVALGAEVFIGHDAAQERAGDGFPVAPADFAGAGPPHGQGRYQFSDGPGDQVARDRRA